MNGKLKSILKLHLTSQEHDLSAEQRDSLRTFCESMSRVRILYRGIDDKYLHKVYNTGLENPPLLSEYIFLFGDKSRHFLRGVDDNKKVYDINDLSGSVFETIYEKLHLIFIEPEKIKDPKSREVVKQFVEKEQEALNFFQEKKKEDWLRRILSLSSQQRQNVKDYYLAFLHTVGEKICGDSYGLSTSTDLEVVKRFAVHNNKKGIILVGWISAKEKNIIKLMCGGDKEIKKLKKMKMELPVFSNKLYKGQKEITLKCGLLPHFIVGYIYGDKWENFEVNPYIFQIEDYSKIKKEGLPIDQSEFLSKITGTHFTMYFQNYEEQYWQLELDEIFPGIKFSDVGL